MPCRSRAANFRRQNSPPAACIRPSLLPAETSVHPQDLSVGRYRNCASRTQERWLHAWRHVWIPSSSMLWPRTNALHLGIFHFLLVCGLPWLSFGLEPLSSWFLISPLVWMVQRRGGQVIYILPCNPALH